MKKTKLMTLVTLLLVCICSFAAFMTACGSDVKVSFSQSEITMTVGTKKSLALTVSGSEDKPEVKSSDESVVTVSLSGKLCSLSAIKEGTATITATLGDVKAECKVTVEEDKTEKVTITIDGNQINELSMEMNTEKTLAATASLGSAITWQSSNEKIATVENGVVKALKPGNATITAAVTGSIKAEVALTVTPSEGYEYYELTLNAGAADATANPGTWAYWTEWCQFTTLEYDNGTINVDFTENGGNWYNMQLFYNNPEVVDGKFYKLSFNIDSSAAGHVTVNGVVLELKEGKHAYEVYFTGGLAFNMQFGVNGPTGIDIPAAAVSISDITWTEDTERVTLQAPSFTYNAETKAVTIQDPNESGVKNYLINLYQGETKVTAVPVVKSGDVLDLSKVMNGDYKAKIQAVALNAHYIDSPESTEAIDVTVKNEGGLSYTFHHDPNGGEANTEMDGGGVQANATAGVWTFWSENWVTVDGKFENEKLNLSFSNNAGNWYDTQIFYRVPGLTDGKIYVLTLNIDSNASGRVTLTTGGGDQEFVIKEGAHDYEIAIVGGGLSIQFTFGINGESSAQEIKAAEMVFEVKGTKEAEATVLEAPSFTYDAEAKTIAITDPNEKGVGGYVLGLFVGESEAPELTLNVKNGDAIDTTTIKNGTYALKLKAQGANLLYTESAWSTVTAQLIVANDKTVINYSEESSADFTSGWRYWDSKEAADWNQSTAAVCEECYIDANGKITLKYTCTGTGAAWAMQMFYKSAEAADGYDSKMSVTSSVDTTIWVSGQSIELKAGVKTEITVSNFKNEHGSAIAIQFGVVGGTFEIEDITVTPAAAE